MKKFASVLFSIVLGVSMILALSGCGEKYFNDNLPSKSALVSVDYGDTTQKKARLQIKNDNESFDISGFALYGKTNKKKIKNLCGGDRLEIYYSDDSYEWSCECWEPNPGALNCGAIPPAPYLFCCLLKEGWGAGRVGPGGLLDMTL